MVDSQKVQGRKLVWRFIIKGRITDFGNFQRAHHPDTDGRLQWLLLQTFKPVNTAAIKIQLTQRNYFCHKIHLVILQQWHLSSSEVWIWDFQLFLVVQGETARRRCDYFSSKLVTSLQGRWWRGREEFLRSLQGSAKSILPPGLSSCSPAHLLDGEHHHSSDRIPSAQIHVTAELILCEAERKIFLLDR